MLLALATAFAGSIDGMAAVDVLTAGSHNPGPGAGAPARLGHTDLGLRLRLNVRELDDRLGVHVDYRGREALGGTLQTVPLRLLFRAEARLELVDGLTLGAGRFVASSPTFTVVDGLRLRLDRQRAWAEFHAGRRAISTSRKNLGGFLPVVGLDGGLTLDRVTLDASLAWSEDQQFVGGTGITQDIGGLTGQVGLLARPTDTVRFGARSAFSQGDAYAIGPTWADGTVEARAIGLFNAMGYVTLQPSEPVRLDLDLLHQNVQSWSIGTVDDVDTVVRPRFTDVRLRARLGPPSIGWFRPMVRYRIRPDRRELRVQARVDVHDLGLPGLFLRTRVAFDDIHGESQAQDVGSRDRTFGAASVGYRRHGFDGSLGASYVQRGATPLSSRTANATTSDDLMPFVLEADPLATARLFYSARRWFVGVDLEKHLSEPEARAYVQIGALTEMDW